MSQPFPNVQRIVISSKGNGFNKLPREVVISHDTLIDMGLFCPMLPAFHNSLAHARECLRLDYEDTVEQCRQALHKAFRVLWQDDTIEVRFDFEIAATGEPYRIRLGHVVMGGRFWLHGVKCQKVAEDKAAIAATGQWLEQSVHADTLVEIDPEAQMETLSTGRHGYRHFDIRRASSDATYHLFTWHHYDGEVPAGLRESSGHTWDEAVDLATTWFARGQRNN